MSERYFIKGVQLGMLMAFIKTHQPKNALKLIEEIVDKQFLGNIDTHWRLDLNDPSLIKNDVKPIILDDNEYSLSKYAEEFPENFEKLNKNLDAPCVVCGNAEEVDSGMCEECRDDALQYLFGTKNKDFVNKERKK